MTNDPTNDAAVKQYRKQLNDAIEAGGCGEVWRAADELRDEPAETGTDRETAGNRGTSRRAVLGGITAATATATIPGTVAAEKGLNALSRRQQLARATNAFLEEYRQVDLPAAVESRADNILETLSTEGFIKRPSLDAFDGYPAKRVRAAGHHDNGVLMEVGWEAVRDTPVVNLLARTETRNGDVEIHLAPTVEVPPVAIIRQHGDRVASITADGNLNNFESTASSCTLCYKDCSLGYVRGENNWDTMCGGCDPGNPCGGGW